MDRPISDRAVPEPAVVETAQQARQGSWGRPVLMVLIAALLLAAVAWAIAEFYGESIDSGATTASETVVPLRI